MSFPTFPHFARLTLDQKDEYLEYYKRLQAPYCDFSINDLFIWLNFHQDLQVSRHGQNIVLRFTDIFADDELVYTFFGAHHVEATLAAIFAHQQKQHLQPRVQMVPAEVVNKLLLSNMRGDLHFEEELENDDYTFEIATALVAQGGIYAKIRNQLRSFRRTNTKIKTAQLAFDNPQVRQDTLHSIEKWMQGMTTQRNDPERWELAALYKHFEIATEIPVYAQGVFVNDDLASVSIYHFPPHREWLVLNHLRCNYAYKDIFNFSFYEMLGTGQKLGKKWLNFEQDLGKQGLRLHKMLLRPHEFLRRYSVFLDVEHKYQ